MSDIYREDIATIDLTEPLRREQVGKTFATGDKLGNRVGVRVRQNHVGVDLSGHAATGYFIRSDLQTVVIPGEVEGELAYVDIPQACLTKRGPFSLALKISGGDVTQTVRVLDGSLILTQTDELIDPGEVIPTLDDIFAQIAAMEAATEEANAAAELANEAAADTAKGLGNKMDLTNVSWEAGKSIYPTGNVGTQSTSLASDYIPVHSPSTITFDDVELRTQRCLCGYDKNKNFVKLLAGNSTETYPTVKSTVTVDIDPEIKYVRATRHNTVASISARYVDINNSLYGAVDYLRERTLVDSDVSIGAANKEQYFSNCDDAPINSIYRILAEAKMENTPLGYGMSTAAGVYDGTLRSVTGYISGTLMTYGVFDSAKHQIFVTNAHVSGEPAIMFFRTFYQSTGWTEWHGVSDILSPTSSNIAIRKKMIAPYLDADGNPTATDTGTPNPQCMIDDPRIFDDFDDAPNNSIYQIDLDCDASVMGNNPRPGKSSVLLTSSFTYRTRHAIYQMCIGLDGSRGSDAFMFYRYCYQVASNPAQYVWTQWERVVTERELSSYMQNKGRIADGSDMDTIRDNSIYLVGDNAGHQNVPSQKAAFLTTKTVNSITLQTYETLDGERYSRNAVGDVWSTWIMK